MPAGRPSDYTPELADEICRRLPGESMIHICLDDHMPTRQTVYNWLGGHPDFFDNYERARVLQAHNVADVPVHMSLYGVGDDPQGAAVQLNACKWTATSLAPKRYSDKLDVTSKGESVQSVFVMNLAPRES